jgi:hypothetical protein
MKKLVKGVHAILANDDGTGALFVKKFPRLGWFIVKTGGGVTVYDGGDEKAAARAIVEYQQKIKVKQ